MQAPAMYSLESYEPPVLKPEEIKQNDNFIRKAFTDKNLNRFYFYGNMPVANPQLINNNQMINNNLININYAQNKFNANIPSTIPLNNPFISNNFKVNNTNKVLNTLQFNNPFANQKINNVKYIKFKPAIANNVLNQQKKNIPQMQLQVFTPQNAQRSNSSCFLPTFPQFGNYQHTTVIKNKNTMPIYRRIINRRKV